MGAVEAFGRSNVNQTLGIALQELRSRRAEELQQKQLDISGRYVKTAENADQRAAELAAIENPIKIAQGESSILKANVEKTAIEENEARLNQKTDPSLNPLFMQLPPEQQKFATELMKRSGILDKDGLATNRSLKNLIDTVETDSKLFNKFSDIGVQSMKNNIQGIYQELQKATESGNGKKVSELTAKAGQLQEQYNNMINFKDKHSKNLEAWGKLPADTQNALAEMGVGPRTYDVEKEGEYKEAVKEYLTIKNMDKTELTSMQKEMKQYKVEHPEWKGGILDFKKMWDSSTKTPEEKGQVTWTTATNNLSKRFGSQDALGNIIITKELQDKHKLSQKKLVELKKQGIDPLEAINTAEDYANQVESKYQEYMTAAKELSGKERKTAEDKIKSAYKKKYGYLPR